MSNQQQKDRNYEFSKNSNRRNHFAKSFKARKAFLDDNPEIKEVYGYALYFTRPSRVAADMAADCDVNLIVSRYQRSGILPTVRNNFGDDGKYRDVADAPSYIEGLNIVAQANEMFAQLPSDVRREFGNSPERFLEAYHDPKRKSFLQELGVLPPDPVNLDDGDLSPSNNQQINKKVVDAKPNES